MVTFNIPVDVFKIAELLGIRVIYKDLGGLENGKGGEFLPKTGVIEINSRCKARNYRRFVLAHELCHSLVPAASSNVRPGKTYNHAAEYVCNEFATVMLIPIFPLQKTIEQMGGLNVEKLAAVFDVPQNVMRSRLVGLRLLGPEKPSLENNYLNYDPRRIKELEDTGGLDENGNETSS